MSSTGFRGAGRCPLWLCALAAVSCASSGTKVSGGIDAAADQTAARDQGGGSDQGATTPGTGGLGVGGFGAGGLGGTDGGGAGGPGAGGLGGTDGGGADRAAADTGPTLPSAPVVLTEDGGWSWFSSARALFLGDRLIVGSLASGWADASRRGDVELLIHDRASGTTSAVELHNQLELDDHDSAALLARADGSLLAVYARHDAESRFYYRSSQPGDPRIWTAEQTFVPSAATRVTYANLASLSAESGRIYNFYRGLDGSFKPSFASSGDRGQTWTSGNVVIQVPTTFRHRPYVRYASNGTDTIHLLYTEGHPRDFDTSIYHAYLRGGTLYRSDGTAIHPLTQGLANPNEGSLIYQADPQHVAWCTDIVLDPADQRPVAAYSVQVGSMGLPQGQGGDDIRYRYARWDGAAWRDYPLAFAGSRLYAGEDDYSGLVAIDPTRPATVYLSTNADPATGAPLASSADGLRHWELYRATTPDGGATWAFEALTRNSTVDNLRPIMVASPTAKALLWLRGKYTSYTSYQQQVVAQFLTR